MATSILSIPIYLDAYQALEVSPVISDGLFELPEGVIFRTFLTSSSSYMDALMRDDCLRFEIKQFLSENLKMPKFIWVTEISTENLFVEGKIQGILLLDATEPSKEMSFINPILACFDNIMYFKDNATFDSHRIEMPIDFCARNFSNLK